MGWIHEDDNKIVIFGVSEEYARGQWKVQEAQLKAADSWLKCWQELPTAIKALFSGPQDFIDNAHCSYEGFWEGLVYTRARKAGLVEETIPSQLERYEYPCKAKIAGRWLKVRR